MCLIPKHQKYYFIKQTAVLLEEKKHYNLQRFNLPNIAFFCDASRLFFCPVCPLSNFSFTINPAEDTDCIQV